MGSDPLQYFSTPEFQAYFEKNILVPILSKVFQYLYPYIIALTLLWVIMFLSIIIILILLFRAKS
jgi:hypothetical protein